MRSYFVRAGVAVLAFLSGVTLHSILMRIPLDFEHQSNPTAVSTRDTAHGKVEYCNVHQKVLMYPAKPQDVYPEARYTDEYFAEMKRSFPHANSWRRIGCGNGPPIEQPISLTCPACRLAETEWNEKHSK